MNKEFCCDKIIFEDHSDENYLLVGFSNNGDDPTEYVILQKALSFDTQDKELRFWRPSLYRWSYSPAGHPGPLVGRPGWNLLPGFAMQGMFAIPGAIFLQFQSARGIFLVFTGTVIASFAFGACQKHIDAFIACHSFIPIFPLRRQTQRYGRLHEWRNAILVPWLWARSGRQ